MIIDWRKKNSKR